MQFIIWTFDYKKRIGGVRILHKLCDYLNSIGETAYVTSEVRNPAWNTPVWDVNKPFDLDTTVVIYPECIPDNKLNAKWVVRWGLYHQVAPCDPSDYIFKFNANYYSVMNKCDGILSLYDFRLDFWENINLERNFNTVVFRKGDYKKQLNYHSQLQNKFIYDEVEEYQDENIIKTCFNKSKVCLSYDATTYIALQAAMCGCVSVVIPDPGVSKFDWLKNDLHSFGVAYGFDDIDRAKGCVDFVKPNLMKHEKKGYESVTAFVEFWKDKIQKG